MSFRHFPSLAGRRFPRALAIALLGFQALLWGGGSIIEARAAAESLARVSHIEDQGTSTCPPFHSHLECQICRTLSGGAGGVSAPAIMPAPGAIEQPVTVVRQVTDRGRGGTVGSRAPPSIRSCGHSTV